MSRLTSKEILTFKEVHVVSDSINAAMVDICMDYGVSRWRFLQSDATAATVANQAYVNLTASIFNVISGTVRIESENQLLTIIDLESVYGQDPDADHTGLPEMYAFDSSAAGTPDTIRMLLWPIPDGVYTINFVAETIMDEDSVSSFPSYLHGALSDRSKELALRNLGHFGEATHFGLSYEKRLAAAKTSQGSDAPMSIRRMGMQVYSNIQSRAN